jgi:hypothetical protein
LVPALAYAGTYTFADVLFTFAGPVLMMPWSAFRFGQESTRAADRVARL